jgi:tagaturonate reductase
VRLNRQLLASLNGNAATAHPERAIQFGTGAFLRGFVDYFIDQANRRSVFNGRVVAVGSTGSGRDRKLNEQDGLYTLACRGIENGAQRHDYQIIGSVSRALSATQQWQDVLACARNPAIELVFSNTTETGIALDKSDKLGPGAPRTFPGKLTSFLLERARHFDFSPERGVAVLPCELIENNADVLKRMVIELAHEWALGGEFEEWLETAVSFCNTLVDRIVPGELDGTELEAAWAEVGYRDELLIVCEPYRLYAIEADERARPKLGFAAADPNILITDDVTLYRERKVRLLNGTHTIMAPLALLAGCKTVTDALQDEQIGAFVRRALFTELVISSAADDAEAFASQAMDRFANPFVRHALLDITLQQTAKMRVRVVPAVVDYMARTGSVPDLLALGFAAYLLYVREAHGNGRPDTEVEAVSAAWRATPNDAKALAHNLCANPQLWGQPLPQSFSERAGEFLQALVTLGVRAALNQHLAVPQRA